jgi:Tfp pilus assembly protein PilF
LDDENKRKLVEMARKSVSLDNREVDYRLTLAKAYDVTGMRTSAQGEVRRALELDPANKDAKELQKALK